MSNKSLFGIEKGVLVQQVNCQNAIGGGLSGAINKVFPIVEEKYRAVFKVKTSEQVFGQKILVECTPDLYVCNLFTQFDYQRLNEPKTGKVYTDVEKLINQVERTTKYFADKGMNVYVPYNIGCGLGGADWKEVFARLKALNYNNLYLINTLKSKAFPIKEATLEGEVIEEVKEEPKKEIKPETKEKISEEKVSKENPIKITPFTEKEKETLKYDCLNYLARDYTDKTMTFSEKEGFIDIIGAKKDPSYNIYRIQYSYAEVVEDFERLENNKGIQIESKALLQKALKERKPMLDTLDWIRSCCDAIDVKSVKLLDKYDVQIFKNNGKSCGISLSTDTGLKVRHTDCIYNSGGDYYVERFLLDDFPKILEESGCKSYNDFFNKVAFALLEIERQLKEQKEQTNKILGIESPSDTVEKDSDEIGR